MDRIKEHTQGLKQQNQPVEEWTSRDYEEKFDRISDEMRLLEFDRIETDDFSGESIEEEQQMERSLHRIRFEEEEETDYEAEEFPAQSEDDFGLMELGTASFEAVDPDAFADDEVRLDETGMIPGITVGNMEMAREFEEDINEFSIDDYDTSEDEYTEEADEEYEGEYEDDDAWELEEDDDATVSFVHSFARHIKRMGALDWIILGTSVIVLILLIVVGGIVLGRNGEDNSQQVAGLRNIGVMIDEVGLIGESGIASVTDITIERLTAAKSETVQSLVEQAGNEKIAIMLNVTTLDHDLKIKFVNAETGKMVGGYEFMVEVTFPSDNTEIYTDTDRDGLIHIQKLSEGSYSCRIYENPEIDSDRFVYSLLTVSTSVKDTIDYVKVDVDDEIKTVDQVVEAEEDLQEKEPATPVESVLQDTVEWVESTKTTIGSNETYTELQLSDIKDPVVASAGKKFMRTESNVGDSTTPSTEPPESSTEESNTEESSTEESESESTSESETEPENPEKPLQDNEKASNAKLVMNPETSTVEQQNSDGVYTFSIDSSLIDITKFTFEWNITVPGNSSAFTSASDRCQASFGKTPGKVSVQVIVTGAGENNSVTLTKEITVTERTATTENAADLSVGVDLSATIKSTATLTDTVVIWEAKTSDESIVKIAAAPTNGEVTVTGVKEGNATVTMFAKTPENVILHTVTCKVTVTKGISASIDTASLSLAGGKTVDLTITAANLPKDATWKVEWASSDVNVATVVAKETNDTNKKAATVTGISSVKESKVIKITATVTVTLNNKVVYTTGLSSDITVNPSAYADTTSVLYTKNNEVVYTMKDGAYVTAVYADYYDKNLKFYKKNEKSEYKYTGWQTINGSTYYFDKNGNKVVGDQVIMGAQYHFASDGSLITGSGSLGIDVSKWNGNINWSGVANSGVSYVIIRCGYRGATSGSLIEDVKFKTNIQGATNAGLKVGVYFFSQAMTEGEAVEEASMCLSLVSGYKISYPIFIDLEATSGGRANNISAADRTKVALAFCKTITNAGYKAGVYANKTWLTSKMDVNSLNGYAIWLAQYASQPTYTGKYDLWQYSSTGKINGISGDVDLNISYLGY